MLLIYYGRLKFRTCQDSFQVENEDDDEEIVPDVEFTYSILIALDLRLCALFLKNCVGQFSFVRETLKRRSALHTFHFILTPDKLLIARQDNF